MFVNTPLKEIFLPESVQILNEQDPFSHLELLENIFVDERNRFFTSLDGVLYTKNFEEIVHYPTAKTAKVYYLPKNLKRIRNQAFLNNPSITALIFKNGITSVGHASFYLTTNIRDFIFPLGITLPSLVHNSLKDYTISYYFIEKCSCNITNFNFCAEIGLLSFIFI